jgi:hypothetical protein
MVDQLFGSKTRVKLLQLFFSNSKKTPEQPVITDVAPEHPLAKDIRATGHVELAFLTGQFTRDDQSGIDILIVGDINQSKVENFIQELEKAEKKELRYTVMPMETYKYRVQINDRFIGNVLAAKKQVIINTQNLIV